jgi:hypothetical protein
VALARVGFVSAGPDVVAKRVADLVGGVEMREHFSALALLELKGYVIRDTSGAFVRNSIGDLGRNPRVTRW